MDENNNVQVMKTMPKFDPNIGKATQFKNGNQAAEMGRKGGKYSGPNKSIGQYLRWLKTRGLTDEKSQELYKLMTDRDVATTKSLTIAEKAWSIANKEGTKESVRIAGQLFNDWVKLRHGQTIKVESRHEEVVVEDKRLRVEFVFPKSKEELLKDVEVRSNGEASHSDAETH